MNRLNRTASLFASLPLVTVALAACSAPTPEVLTQPAQASAQSPLVVGSGNLFFVDAPDPEIATTTLARIPIAGGAPATLVPSLGGLPVLATDAVSVFDGMQSFTLPGPNTWSFAITRVPQAGGAPQTLATAENAALVGMAVAGGRLAYASVGMEFSGTSPFGRTAKGSGAVFVQPVAALGETPPPPVAIAANLEDPCALASDGVQVYWLDCSEGELLTLPLGAGAGAIPKVLASGLALAPDLGGGPQIAAAAGRVYWFEGTALRTMPAAGGAPSTIASEAAWAPAQILADENDVYWMTIVNVDDLATPNGLPGLWTVSTAGGAMRQVLGQGDLGLGASGGAVAIDASSLYWIDADDGTVHSLAR